METIEQPETATKFALVEDELASLGLNGASGRLKNAREFKRKIGIAFERYRFITNEQIEKFKIELYTRTNRVLPKSKEHPYGGQTYDTLVFTALENYLEVPPRQALDKLKEARSLQVFDKFEVCTVESVTKLNDPIIFGIVNGDTRKFAICEWDDDISIAQLLNGEQG